MLNYLDSPITAPYFCFFNFVWIYLRHYTNLRILFSIATSFATVGPFELNWETQQYKSWISQYITFALLASLQAINLIWLYFILRVGYNIVFKKVEKDVRSDDEESSAEDEVLQEAPVAKKKASKAALTNGHTKEPALSTGVQVKQPKVSSRGQAPNGRAKH